MFGRYDCLPAGPRARQVKNMLECLVLGDSIAVGTAVYRQECVALAVEGITSRAWSDRFAHVQLRARTAVISLGTNDAAAVDSEAHLRAVRARVQAQRVHWILPAQQAAARAVARLAIEHGDVIVLVRHQGKDGIHPSRSGYARLATLTRVSVGPGVQIIDERLQ